MSVPLEIPYEVIKVISKESGDLIKIKDYRFDPELHERAGSKPKIKKVEKETKPAPPDSLKMSELRKIAKEKGITVPFGTKKTDLIKMLND